MSNDLRSIAHQWAHGVDKRYSRQNVFAENRTIFSYGRHFPMARFYGPDVVLFTSHSYGVSTSRHLSYVRQAIPSRCRVFVVDKVSTSYGGSLTKAEHKNNHKVMIEAIGRAVVDSQRPRLRADTRAAHLARAEKLRWEANDYRAHFKLGGKPLASIGVAVDVVARIDRAAEVQRKRDEVRREENERSRIAEQAELLREWVAGKNNANFFGYDAPVAFRLKAGTKGRVVQSSKGAEFTAVSARAAYPRLVELRALLTDREDEYKPADDCRADDVLTISGFRAESVSLSGVVVGCHSVGWQAVEELALLLGFGVAVAEGVNNE